MWRENLDELVRLVGKLPDVKVSVEANDNTATDLAADLPQLGPRLAYFTVTGLRASGDSDEVEVVRVHLANNGSYIEAVDPDFDTLGLFREVETLVRRHRRIPAKLAPFFDVWGLKVTPTIRRDSSFGVIEIVQGQGGWSAFSLIAFWAAGVFAAVFGVSAVQHMMHPHHQTAMSWPASIWVEVPTLLVAAIITIGWLRARTVLLTATHATAPTWWERNRAPVSITVISSALSLYIGWLIAH